MELRPAFPGRSHQDHGEAGLKCHGHQRGFAVPGDPFNPHVPGVHRRVRFQVIQAPRGAPGPGAQRAPILRLARLPVIDQANDPLGQPRAVIGLDTAGINGRVSPPGGNQLLGGRWITRAGAWSAPPGTAAPGARESPHPEHHQHRHGRFGLRRCHQRHLDFDFDLGETRVVHSAHELLGHCANITDYRVRGLRSDRPGHLRHHLWYPPNHLTFEVLDDLRPALGPPHLRRGDFHAVLERQHLGQVGERISLGGIVIGGVRGVRGTARPRAEGGDAQLRQHVAVILAGRPVERHGPRMGCPERRFRGETRP